MPPPPPSPTLTHTHPLLLLYVELQGFGLHELKHVEEAVVAGGGEALVQAQRGDEVGLDAHHLIGGASTEPLDQEGCQALQHWVKWECTCTCKLAGYNGG
jgi:hypothetical protein